MYHIKKDLKIAEVVKEYLQRMGFSTYLDVNDRDFSQAVYIHDCNEKVASIQKGLDDCDALICIISDKTLQSWWVPFEIGYAKAGKRKIASIKTKDVESFPEYLQVEETLSSTQDLRSFLGSIVDSRYGLLFSHCNIDDDTLNIMKSYFG